MPPAPSGRLVRFRSSSLLPKLSLACSPSPNPPPPALPQRQSHIGHSLTDHLSVLPHERQGGGMTGPPGHHRKQNGTSRIAGGRTRQRVHGFGRPVMLAVCCAASPAARAAPPVCRQRLARGAAVAYGPCPAHRSATRPGCSPGPRTCRSSRPCARRSTGPAPTTADAPGISRHHLPQPSRSDGPGNG